MVDVLLPPICAKLAKLLVPACMIRDRLELGPAEAKLDARSALIFKGAAIFAAEDPRPNLVTATAFCGSDWTLPPALELLSCAMNASAPELELGTIPRRPIAVKMNRCI